MKLSFFGSARSLLWAALLNLVLLIIAIPLYAAQVTLALEPNSPTADGYRLYCRTEGTNYNYSNPIWSGTGTTCNISNLTDNTTYYFVARVYAGTNQSANSNEVTFRYVPPATSGPVIHTIVATAGANGSISPSGSASVAHGSSQAYSIKPATGYRIANVVVDGVSKGALASYTFSQVTANHSIAASFAALKYTVTATANNGGTITPPGSVSVAHGSSQAYSIKPETGYRTADVKVDGVSKGALSSYTFSQVTANHSIAASFAALKYTVTATAGNGGTITPPGSLSVAHGSSQVYSINPASGYRIADVMVDGASKGVLASYTFSQINSNHAISASFDPIDDKAPIIIDDGDAGTHANGRWPVSGGIAPFGTQSLYSKEIGAAYTYEPVLTGRYEIALWWSDFKSRCSNVPVEIYDGDVLLETVYVDQQQYGGQWNVLGTYAFAGKARVSVISESSECSTCADALKLVDAGPIVIDNGDSETSSLGRWSLSGGTHPYGSQSLYSKAVGAAYAYESPLSGRSEVALWWSGYDSRCSNVPVEIYDGDRLLETVYVDQRQNSGQWNSLGTYGFSGKARVIIVAENSECSTCADAVKLDVAAEPQVIDDGDTGTSSIGKWSISGGKNPFETQSLYSKEAGAAYSYESMLTGRYEVALWWSGYDSRCSNVPVEIFDGDLLLDTVYLNQRQGSGQWNVLGEYTFTGKAIVTVVSESNRCSTCADAIRYSK